MEKLTVYYNPDCSKCKKIKNIAAQSGYGSQVG